MKIKLSTALLILLMLALYGPLSAQKANDQSEPKVVAIVMYADWCGTCKALDPKIGALKQEFKEKPILFTAFDFTDKETARQSKMMASLAGMTEIFNESNGKTGYVVLVDVATRKEVGRITSRLNDDDMRKRIASALD